MKKTVEHFVVPSLSDMDPVYRDLKTREQLLREKQYALAAESGKLESEMAEEPKAAYSTSVASLLGEDLSDLNNAAGKRARLQEIRKEERDVEVALSIVLQRLRDQKPTANTLVVEACREEYGRRVASIVDALRIVDAARQGYYELRDQFEHEDIAWSRLVPMSINFLGDRNDGYIQRVIAEMKEAGYVS